MSIGNNIKMLRAQYGLSQKELAVIAGVTDKAVSAWENGKILPRMGPIQKMADRFGIKKSDIIEPITATADTARIVRRTSNPRILNEDQIELLDGFDSLSVEGQKDLLKHLGYLKFCEKGKSLSVESGYTSGRTIIKNSCMGGEVCGI